MKYSKSLHLAAMLLIFTASTNAFASNMFPKDVFVTLKDSGELAKFAGEHKWKGEPVMLYNAITPDGKRLVVSSPKMQTVYVFDTKTHKRIAQVKVGKASKGLKISPNGKEVYVANEGEASISVVDLEKYENVATIKTDDMPHNVRFSHDGKKAYVTLQGGAGLGVIDTKTRKVERVIPTPGLIGAHNLDISKDGKIAYIRDTSNHMGFLDLMSGKMLKVLQVGQGHAGIDVSPDGKTIYTGAIADEIVTVIDAKSMQVVNKIKVGFGPHGVRTSKNGRWLYVAVTADDKFVVIDTKSNTVEKEYTLAAFPFWVSVQGNP